MKRIRDFSIRASTANESVRMESWHKVWDYASERISESVLEEGLADSVIEVFDPTDSLLIARFSSINEEKLQRTESPEAVQTWETRPLRQLSAQPIGESAAVAESAVMVDVDGQVRQLDPRPEEVHLFANLNTSDFHWIWIDGATREVPVRLSFLQRAAAKKPNGIWAFGYGLIGEYRDMFRR